MIAKELERLIAESGGNPVALDTVTRKLREATKLSSRGRGFNSPSLSASEVVYFLMAYGGSEVVAQSARSVLQYSRYLRPEPVLFGSDPCTLMLSNSAFAAMVEMLTIPELLNQVQSVRFARNIGLITIVLHDGHWVTYAHEDRDLSEVEALAGRSYLSEGVLSHGLLKAIAEAADWFGRAEGEQVA